MGPFYVWEVVGTKLATTKEVSRMLGSLSPVSVTSSGGHGSRPDYGSGPYLELMTAAVRLAHRDLRCPEYDQGARDFLDGDLVALFLDCLTAGER